MTSLSKKLSAITGNAFHTLGLPIDLGINLGVVHPSDRPDLAQFQCNGAMAAAKKLGKNPREVAQEIINQLASRPEFAKLGIAGPGFINIHVTDAFLSAHMLEISADPHLGTPETGESKKIVLDYGGPNIAKPMHVGHLRSSIIGDCLRRLHNFAGYNAISDVHMGDWGTPMGMILSELALENSDAPITMERLAEIYPKAATDCKADEARMILAREATRKLQEGDPENTRIWREFIDISIEGMKANFEALGVHFDEWKGESDAHPFITPMIADFKAKGVAVESEGALVVPVAQESDKKEIPPLILLKSDGAVLYSTTDLATIIDRIRTHNPVKIIYCVDQRQSLHFEQVFRAALKGGIVTHDRPELIFAGFGTMNGPDGKPFKTRAGGVMRLEDLIQMGVERAHLRLEEAALAQNMTAAQRADIAHKIAIAAIKFADLQNNRTADYIFDIDRMTQLEGKTGPYLLYQAVRIKSLLLKAGDESANAAWVIEDEDRPLALLISEFPDHFELALKNCAPHVLCDYASKLAQAFSSFYGNCHILSEPRADLRTSRLALCRLTHAHLALILGLLGIEIPERM